ncbi:LuxR family transcriptional regulator [Enemella dayhoffiae]|uniref:LuxR family transcriptional regulator n=1 Tax=Enemella dayhoffiae TaxID=2016507 RepID=A0A255GWU1_9ACTN|nr:LuxR C-terminal-related transcriptional regulator [Enemella dayhoffiae]OYO19313.1 LuxR family transcriptional regulator [Enemella dayhoffiae]
MGQLSAPMTRFIGRGRTVPQAESLICENRLVSLIGPGGIGKTRLALELAGRLDDQFADGCAVAALEVVVDPTDVPWGVASALEIADLTNRDATERLTNFLGRKQLLLVLDNCEHLLESAADLVLTVLTRCPGVHVLTTSREPLGLEGEHVLTVPPLELPERDSDPATVTRAEAVALLLERAAQAGSPLEVTEKNCAAIAELCRRLDGMPLAIELAAVRLRSLSAEQILDRLDARFLLLRRNGRGLLPRHQTLRNLVDWSYELCSPAEQLLWARMSVFTAGCDLDAAEAVAGFGSLRREEVLDLLDALVAKSIVLAEQTPLGMRYRQLVTIRDYGAELAAKAAETGELHRRHRDLMLERARGMVRTWAGPDQQRSLALMRADHADAITAMEWSLATPGEGNRAAELGALLRYHWVSGAFLPAGRHRLEQVLASPEVTGRDRAEALWVAAWVALISGDHALAEEHLSEAEPLAAELADAFLRGQVANWTGLLHLFRGNGPEAVRHYRRAAAIFTELGDEAALETALFQLGLSEIYGDSPAAALRTSERLIAISDRNGESWFRAYVYWVRGIALWHQGELDAARTATLETLQIQAENLDGICIAHTLTLGSCIAVDSHDFERAARLQGLAEAVWCTLGTHVASFGPGLEGDRNAAVQRARSALGADAWQRAVREANGLDHLGAVHAGLDEVAKICGTPAPNPVGLTRREAQIADLVADGLSNKEIAHQLTISTRTVDGHVENILHKFGVRSRAKVAAQVLSQRTR